MQTTIKNESSVNGYLDPVLAEQVQFMIDHGAPERLIGAYIGKVVKGEHYNTTAMPIGDSYSKWLN